MIEIGEKAPDFTLLDHHNKEFKLSDHSGKKVLLSFHPLAWTSVCAKQMKMLDEKYDEFISLNIIPVGISVDSVPSKHAWARELKLSHIQILSDFWPHGEVAKLYGIFRQKDGFSERANILIGENGVVLWVKLYDIPQLPDVEEILDFIRNAG